MRMISSYVVHFMISMESISCLLFSISFKGDLVIHEVGMGKQQDSGFLSLLPTFKCVVERLGGKKQNNSANK